ncbi:juvenile hormone esterase-like [Malaya genurostris]|uniref:juvenile hormone esterase-like n=1 Tax=Malaya genurostris TaxID=325434 RepID=UPI0026F3C835|nr:juvenile hormone esterase-like [Malaya genurostris]XP_058461355.1 juvenile hormone esterase-like [Malaya genurostris]XP_058461356.1 juvenile hormone esterase-like [Malaya genurostris]XP_058461357.1 juvenile hormone esterase-like [Malaya genurostris]XP_058461358.1 juvenile hormone esterase-like [Malaya genurostris]XP_058461359.1 juvenile hormone esterase-like [Malaya genurostris]
MRNFLCKVIVLVSYNVYASEFQSDQHAGELDATQHLKNPKYPLVCIDDGCLRGKNMDGFQAGPFDAFIGIPFAKPPVGKLRFANPVRNDPWEKGTIYNATEEKSMCLQKNDLIPNALVAGSEDCLYLNVYRPKDRNTTKAFPVMVYIHGGGFFAGSASPSVVGPEYIMDAKRTILVTLQYRLGVFGFFSTGDGMAPGNFGLKDQVMALQWVKKNIAEFGGNPELVTIFGQSAGGASVHMHMMSPMSEGLFSRVIMMSGNAIAPWNIPTKDPFGLAVRQTEAVDVPCAKNLSSEQIVNVLRNVDATVLSKSIDKLKFWSIDPLTLYRPVIESSNWSDQAFLVEDPRVSWQKGNYQQLPWMTSFVPNDGAVRAIAITSNEKLLKELNANISYILPKLLEKEQSNELLRLLKNRYFNDSSDEEWINQKNAYRLTDLYTEGSFLYPIQSAVKQYVTVADTKKAPVSIYKFNFKGRYSYSFYYTFTHQDYGVVHCDDLIYIFRSPALFQDFPRKSKEALMSHNLVQFFIDFAINGVATPLKPYRSCDNENEIYQSMDCDVLEFTNSDELEKPFEVRIFNGRNEDLFTFWNKFY